MFTGIVAGRARVESVEDADGLRVLRLALPTGLGAGLQLGASVASQVAMHSPVPRKSV